MRAINKNPAASQESMAPAQVRDKNWTQYMLQVQRSLGLMFSKLIYKHFAFMGEG